MTDVENLILYNGELDLYTANIVFPNWTPTGGDLNDNENRIRIEALRHAKEFSQALDDEDILYKNSTLSKFVSFVFVCLFVSEPTLTTRLLEPPPTLWHLFDT